MGRLESHLAQGSSTGVCWISCVLADTYIVWVISLEAWLSNALSDCRNLVRRDNKRYAIAVDIDLGSCRNKLALVAT